MNLSDYINLTLNEIAEGVENAAKSYKKKGNGCVLSEIEEPIEGIPFVRICSLNKRDTYKPIIKVAFRVGVEVEESAGVNSKTTGSLKVISANVESLSKDEKRSIHEVSFELPLILPKK